MKRKNGKMLRGGMFGVDFSAMMGLKPKDVKIAPEVHASSSGQYVKKAEQLSRENLGSNNKIEGGKKRKSRKNKKSKSQKKR